MTELLDRIKTAAPAGEETARQRRLYWAWNIIMVVLAGCGIGLVSLVLAYGDYSWGVFLGYFRHPLIAFLNILPVVLFLLLCWCLTGRAWVSFLLTCALFLSASVGSYFKLMFRDDPFVFADISSITTAMGVAGNYAIGMDKRLWFTLGCVIFGAVFLAKLVRGKPGRQVRILGAAAVLLLLFALCLRTLRTGLQCPDALGCNICVGIFAALFLQCVINIGMNLQVLPVIGVTLPFFSAGGSSVVMMYLCVGIVLSVGMNTRRSKLEMQQIL